MNQMKKKRVQTCFLKILIYSSSRLDNKKKSVSRNQSTMGKQIYLRK